MQQQLRRIKNKDLSTLDERLFGNLDKVQTINSTIENLGQFQQFLLKQISQFEQKAKTKNKSKQFTEVIEQNCLTLRESIMNVIPDDLESSRSRMRQTVTSPINGFRSTRTNKFVKDPKQQDSLRGHESLESEFMKKIEYLQLALNESLKKQEELKKQISKIKGQYSTLNWKFEDLEISLKKQFQVKLRKQVDCLISQNQKLKEEINWIKKENYKLSQVASMLKKKSEDQKQENVQKQLDNSLLIQKNEEFKKPHKSSNFKKSQIKQSPRTQSKEPHYMSFKEKMKFDFTSKLNKFQTSELKEQAQSQEIEGGDTFREVNTIELDGFESVCESAKSVFRSIEISRNQNSDLDPNVPKLLKRNSISGQYQSVNVSQQKLVSQHRVTLETYDSNIGVRSNYQSAQKPKNDPMTSKKSNHDLMRKTKSNFFKLPIQNKENAHVMENFYDTNIAKMKGIVNQSNPNERKRNSQSKQKLKIFSMI